MGRNLMGGLSAEAHKGHVLGSFVVKSMQQEAAESMEPIYQSVTHRSKYIVIMEDI